MNLSNFTGNMIICILNRFPESTGAPAPAAVVEPGRGARIHSNRRSRNRPTDDRRIPNREGWRAVSILSQTPDSMITLSCQSNANLCAGNLFPRRAHDSVRRGFREKRNCGEMRGKAGGIRFCRARSCPSFRRMSGNKRSRPRRQQRLAFTPFPPRARRYRAARRCLAFAPGPP